MRCPACNKTVEPDAWLCPFCEHIIDPSVLAPAGDDDEDDDLAASEPTRMMPMPLPPASTDLDGPLPDAVILGDVGVAADEFSAFEGAGVQSDGRTSTFLYYATGASTRVVHPDAVPRLTRSRDGQPRTPYEDFILSCVDGTRTVRQIQRTSGLQPQEVAVTLLTLMDKGAVEIRSPDGGPGASPASGRLAPDPAETEPRAPRAKSRPRSRPRRRAASLAAAPTEEGMPVVSPQPLDAEERLETQSLMIPSVHTSPVPAGFDEDLPSVSDFHEIDEATEHEDAGTDDVPDAIVADVPDHELEPEPELEPEAPRGPPPVPEERTQLGLPPTRPPIAHRDSSLSDVWSGSASSAVVAEDEDWGPLTGQISDHEIIQEAADPSMELAAVVPTDLDEDDEPDVTKEIFIPAKLRAPRPEDRAPSLGLEPEPAMVSASVVSAPPPTAPAAPMLDPSLLMPPEPSQVMPSPVLPKPAQRLAEAARRAAPIEERDRRRPGAAKAKRAAAPEPPAPEPQDEVQDEAPKSAVDSLRMVKAQKLFDQAVKDRSEGNIVSARMNIKLAITFDPTNELFQTALAEFELAPTPKSSGPRPTGRSKAREFYDAATAAENQGDVDRAIELLEKAVAESRQAVFLNRLGVVLAMKKREFVRAQQLIEEAIEMSPGNATYEKNLHKILARAATADVNAGNGKDKKGGRILGFLGRRK